ncbi:hypothetical protein KEM56_005932 [Ascosphaera pollenicola]|nr:hypothetical protein KEM56_005932 [Ascosphaera pollenicola]
MKACAALFLASLALPALSQPISDAKANCHSLERPSMKTAFVNAAEHRGAPESLAAGIIYGEPDTLNQIPDYFYEEAGLRFFRAGGAQLGAPDRGWIWGEYEGRFNSAKSNYVTARKHGGTFSLLPHDMWGTDHANETSLWPGDNDDWADYDKFLDRLIGDLKKHKMLENLQFDTWNEPELTFFWNRTTERWVSLWDCTYKRIRSNCELNDVVITGPSLSGYPTPESPWWTQFLESVSKERTIPDQWVWHMEREPADVTDDIQHNIPALQVMLSNYSLPTNVQININEYGKTEEQVPAGAAWWIARLERYDAIGMRGNWLSKLQLHDFLANLLGKPNAENDELYDYHNKDYWPVGEWQVYKYYHTNMTGVRLGTQGSDDRTLDVYSALSDDKVLRVLAGVRLAQGAFTVQIDGVEDALGVENGKGSVTVKTLRFDNNGKWGRVDGPKVVEVKKFECANGRLKLDFKQSDNEYPALTTRSIHLPRILDPNLYRAIIPKGWSVKPENDAESGRLPPTRNPALYYTIIFLLIGSQAIHLLVLRKEREGFERSSDARIRVLKDVIGRLQRGEDIDVKKVLGTGDEKQEKSWEELIREIEEEEMWRRRDARAADAAKREAQEASKSQEKPQEAELVESNGGQAKKPMFF